MGLVTLAGLWVGGPAGASAVELPESMYFSGDGAQLLQGGKPASGLYDQTVLRTLQLTFKQTDWWQQMVANYASEVSIPADLAVEGVTYPDVGVRFKGATSYSMTGNSQKKSFNISMDFKNPAQRLMGYRTLNLNNAAMDPTFMREVTYFDILRRYTPGPKACFVKLIINGESWGIYVHVQQENAELVEEWFLNNDGNRWKAGVGALPGGAQPGGTFIGGTQPPGTFPGGTLPAGTQTPGTFPGGTLPAGTIPPGTQPGGTLPPRTQPGGTLPPTTGTQPPRTQFGGTQPGGTVPGGTIPGGTQPGGGRGGFTSGNQALLWLGSDSTSYVRHYELKSAHTPDPWSLLIATCNVLNNTPAAQLPDSLETVLAVDRWLWFLAVENLFTDEDGYLTKGWDYQFYYDVKTRQIHPLEHDGNEAFTPSLVRQSPVEGATNANRPVISKLLSIPHLRQRYLAHMRTALNESFDTRILAPKMDRYRALIEKEVLADTRKLYSNDQFASNYTDLQGLIATRRAFLITHAEINRPAPEITSVARKAASEISGSPAAGQPVLVTAKVGGGGVAQAILYHADGVVGRFKRTAMFDDGAHGDEKPGDGVYGASIPAYPAGSLVRYYVEARATDDVGTAAFAPAGAEHNVFVYRVSTTVTSPITAAPVVINEFMASNTKTLKDPQGEYDDWIELLNVSGQAVDLSKMYLSDTESNPKKWAFPDGTRLGPGAYLLVWADENGNDRPGLHASFKLSASGESILLVDRDDRGNAILDIVKFGAQNPDVSTGRSPDSTGEFKVLSAPTPGAKNVSTGPSSDFNGSGKTDFDDFFLFAAAFGKKQATPGYEPTFDLDSDGEIGFSDFFIFAAAFGQ